MDVEASTDISIHSQEMTEIQQRYYFFLKADVVHDLTLVVTAIDIYRSTALLNV